MIEVKMYLYDAQEINMMAQFEAILAQKRAQAPAFAQGGTDAAPAVATQGGSEPASATVPEAPDVQGAAHTPVPMPSAPDVDDVTMQRTITTYGQKNGVPATVARMQELFGVSQASKVPTERRAEFVAAFSV